MCGTVSVFFLILGGIITIINKRKNDAFKYLDDFYDISDSDYDVNQIQKNNTANIDDEKDDLSSCSRESAYYD